MKKYIVIALSVEGRNNKIYYSGDEVQANFFADGSAEELCRDGFLKEASGEGEKPNAENFQSDPELSELIAKCIELGIDYPENASKEQLTELIDIFLTDTVIAGFKGRQRNDKMVLKIDDITVKDIISDLRAVDAKFDTQSKKSILFAQWIQLTN